jgi:hypothetical protein
MDHIQKQLIFLGNEIKEKVRDANTSIYLMHLVNSVRTLIDNAKEDKKDIEKANLYVIKALVEKMNISQSSINFDIHNKMSKVTVRRLFYMIRHIGLEASLLHLANEFCKHTNDDPDVLWYLQERKLDDKLASGG